MSLFGASNKNEFENFSNNTEKKEDQNINIDVDSIANLGEDFKGTEHGNKDFIEEKQKENEKFIEKYNSVYEELCFKNFIDGNGRIINKIEDQKMFDDFFDDSNRDDYEKTYKRREEILLKVIEDYLKDDIKAIKYIKKYSKDEKDEEKYYFPNFLKNIISSLQKKIARETYKHEEDNNYIIDEEYIKEVSKKIETLKCVYIKYEEKKFNKEDGGGFKKEDDFYEKIKIKLEEKFEDKFYVLRSSKFDDIAHGIDFIMYYKGIDENNLPKDTPIACIDLGNIFQKYCDNKSYRLRDVSDYIYHDYKKNEYRKWFRRNTPIFNVDTEKNSGWYYEFVKSFYKQLPEFNKNSKIKEDYKWRLQEVLKELFNKLPKDQRERLKSGKEF